MKPKNRASATELSSPLHIVLCILQVLEFGTFYFYIICLSMLMASCISSDHISIGFPVSAHFFPRALMFGLVHVPNSDFF